MAWFRIDNRLVHGQVIETWLPYLNAHELVVINDALASDALQQQIMQLAIPERVHVRFIPLSQAKAAYNDLESRGVPALYLVANCRDAFALHKEGVHIAVLNIGNVHYEPGKQQICPHIALSEDDKTCLRHLAERGVSLDFRCVPTEPPLMEKEKW